ncbi:MAG: ribosomal L7Ae/L30e/S12e/Gadd45 family protein, partial [Candidatus Aenigmarchaeota archaeon]|nr:ribosomal L7Ae/L30e/S12e/Gadd45 family protein [Candidatus Aenigmarchaeota archaeon]
METIEKLPEGKPMIGAKEIAKAINSGRAGKIVIASNCPEFLEKRIKDSTKSSGTSVEIFRFAGDQMDLG